jgi:murein DD-endopeptidase MepM/ murein hydrolase activator NlpD
MSRRRFDQHKRFAPIGALLFGAVCVAIAGCQRESADDSFERPVPTARRALEPPAVQVLRGRAWLEAAQLALEQPTRVELPHAEWGGFFRLEPNARGIAFTGIDGQLLEIQFAQPEADAPGQPARAIDVELFVVEERADGVQQVRLAEMPAGESSLRFELPRDATYIVRLRPEPSADALYYVKLELDAALPFPVRGYTVKSFFGASRESGKRHHEGIDIYAPRRTPVLAVADGNAMYRENPRGGHSVWVNTAGVSYYYAHLERVAVGGGERVRTGDVIGYVGNSGNAANLPPHLHFGVYKWGRDPVDPMPLLEARRFDDVPGAEIGPEEPETLWRLRCAARFPQSLSSLRVCLASGAHSPAPDAELPLPLEHTLPPLDVAVLPIERAPATTVLELVGEGGSSCRAVAAAPSTPCFATHTRRVMVF